MSPEEISAGPWPSDLLHSLEQDRNKVAEFSDGEFDQESDGVSITEAHHNSRTLLDSHGALGEGQQLRTERYLEFVSSSKYFTYSNCI